MVVVAFATALLLGLRNLGDQRVGREQQCRHAGGVLQGRADNLGGINDPGDDQIAILPLVGVVAVVAALHVPHAIDHHGTIHTRIAGNGLKGIPKGLLDNRCAHLLVVLKITLGDQILDRFFAPQESHATAWNDALGQRGLNGALGVFDQSLSLFHLGLGRGTHIDLGNATGDLGKTLLQLFTVIVAGGSLDLRPNLLGTAVDGFLRSGTADDRGVLGFDDYLLGAAQVAELDGIERDPKVLENCLSTRQHSQVSQNRLPTIAVARGLDGDRLNNASQLVDNERRQCLTLDVLGNHHERLAGLADGLQQRHEALGTRDLFLKNQDQGILHDAHLRLRIGHEVGREETSVELHPFDDID